MLHILSSLSLKKGTSYTASSFISMSIFSLWVADVDMAIFPVNWIYNFWVICSVRALSRITIDWPGLTHNY